MFLRVFVILAASVPVWAKVQAFVPMLEPLEYVTPVYPAVEHSWRSSVELLVTIDQRGVVIDVQALTGRDIFRQPAIDAVKRQSYRPVIRNGAPVEAITNATVIVEPPRQPGQPPVAWDTDMAQTMAASSKMLALRQKFPRSPTQVLVDLEQDCGDVSQERRNSFLDQLAKAAVNAGDFDKAGSYANEMLKANQDAQDWNYGNAIHDGNMVLGLVALQQGAVGQAKQYLLAAGKTPGSPQLNSFGPNMTLAKALLQKGERDVVLEYFDLCRKFWKMHQDKLDQWSATVRGGGTPDFGANLLY